MGTLKVDGHIEGNYIKSQWLYTSAATALTSAAKIACIGSDNYIYYIAPANMSVGQADKLDGYHADSFLLKSGGTMTGAITMSESTGFAMAFSQNQISLGYIQKIIQNSELDILKAIQIK